MIRPKFVLKQQVQSELDLLILVQKTEHVLYFPKLLFVLEGLDVYVSFLYVRVVVGLKLKILLLKESSPVGSCSNSLGDSRGDLRSSFFLEELGSDPDSHESKSFKMSCVGFSCSAVSSLSKNANGLYHVQNN